MVLSPESDTPDFTMSEDILGVSTPDIPVVLAKPPHIQRLEHALRLDPLLNYVESITSCNKNKGTDTETSTDAETDYDIHKHSDGEGNKIYNGVKVSKPERKSDKSRLYNFSKIKKSRKWLKNVLLSDTSSDESDDEKPLSRDDLHHMLKQHKFEKKCRQRFSLDKDYHQYQYYSTGLLSNQDKYLEHQKLILGPRRKVLKEQKKLEKKLKKGKLKKMHNADGVEVPGLGRPPKEGKAPKSTGPKPPKVKKVTPEQMAAKRRKLWISLCKKEIAKQQKQKLNARKELLSQLKKVAKECQKECRKAALQSQKIMKEASIRARRLSKEMMVYWKRFEKVEKEHRKKAEKEAMEQRKMDLEIMEMKRQQRKLNFLITQTELYAHFMARKMTGQTDHDRDTILSRLDEDEANSQKKSIHGTVVTDVIADDYDYEERKATALRNAENALYSHQEKTKNFDEQLHGPSSEDRLSFANPAISTDVERPQPAIFQGKLKGYQLKGMNWLANLYDQGINGILADEMGLGKTVQSISLLAYLAESQGIWGPFLIVAPASTLHNWQQEISRFLPDLKVVPYWGNTQDRKILRKFWNQDNLHTQDASFHCVITSYQLVIQDVKYFQRIRWHYMILDEAQAIKSSASARWKVLLCFSCRNRLLLTGTPIQNSMAELWALLHFIMPTLFDSHDEFNEWFSKDIESHVEKQSSLDEDQLSRLHMILKPFMLRRIKKDVENELSDKIEIMVCCPLTLRQQVLYQAIKNKISIEDLVLSANSTNNSQAQNTASSLMNLVMQFRKVCNHPELFERRDIRSPLFMQLPPYNLPKLLYREGILSTSFPSQKHLLFNKLYIFSPAHIHQSLHSSNTTGSSVNSCFSFTRFIDLSPAELYRVMYEGLLFRWLLIISWLKRSLIISHERSWQQAEIRECSTRYFSRTGLVIEPQLAVSPANVSQSATLRSMVFTSPRTPTYAFLPHTLHYMPESASHRKIRLRRHSGSTGLRSPGPGKKGPLSPPGSPVKSPLSPTKKGAVDSESVHPHKLRPSRVLPCQATEVPDFLYYNMPKLHARVMECYCFDRSAAWERMSESLCGTQEARLSLMYGTRYTCQLVQRSRHFYQTTEPGGTLGIAPKHGISKVIVPGKESLVTDAGKLYVLDTLLERLKCEGHRVLIYSQMTRMIDILEEYMWHRKHTYIRLDGSSKISDRRDMVADFQSRSDIFVFLLSTRAGGLGINLTAADTVIFYDSDWNPTVDQQAMDRAHRLGQTKQVTVYRLICKGSIEERILQRAREKSEIQKMVISGGNYRPDTLKPKEVVSLLLDDDEMERKLRLKQEERRKQRDDDRKAYGKRKPALIPGMGKQRSGRGPGRPPKRPRIDLDVNSTTPSATPTPTAASSEADFNMSFDSMSAAASPQSVVSGGSELTQTSLLAGDESSNDALVIVDDGSMPSVSSPSTPGKRGRPRGRPRGSGGSLSRRPRGRGSVQKALGAAEAAAAQAAKKAAYEAYGYSFSENGDSPPSLKGAFPVEIKSRRGRRNRGRANPPKARP